MLALPALRPREVIAFLTALGFREVRQCSSHKCLAHPDGHSNTVPVHGSRDITPVLPRRIARDSGLTAAEFARRGR
jgi:predicted RNA binding protein YcfA (HicA-like mRNA interferase family)